MLTRQYPCHLSFNPVNGVISGAPLVTGTFNVTIRAGNEGGTGSTNLVLTIRPEPAPELTATWSQNGLLLSFLALATHHYTVQRTDDLANNNWLDLFITLVGGGWFNP